MSVPKGCGDVNVATMTQIRYVVVFMGMFTNGSEGSIAFALEDVNDIAAQDMLPDSRPNLRGEPQQRRGSAICGGAKDVLAGLRRGSSIYKRLGNTYRALLDADDLLRLSGLDGLILADIISRDCSQSEI